MPAFNSSTGNLANSGTVTTNGLAEESKIEEVQDETIKQLEEKLVGRGIAVALQVFRERGMLGKSRYIGRNKDQSGEALLKTFGDKNNQEDDRVKLEYMDKKGRKLTQKEAFRQMCWKFHGKMPSHRKQEKQRAKEEMEDKQNKISLGLNPQAKVVSSARKLGNLGSLKKPKAK